MSKGPCNHFSESKLSFLAIFAGFLSLLPDLHMDGHTERPPYEDTRTKITAPSDRTCPLLKQSAMMIFFLAQWRLLRLPLLLMDGQTDGQTTEGKTDRRTDKYMDGGT